MLSNSVAQWHSRIIKKLENLSQCNSTPGQDEYETHQVDPMAWLHPQHKLEVKCVQFSDQKLECKYTHLAVVL